MKNSAVSVLIILYSLSLLASKILATRKQKSIIQVIVVCNSNKVTMSLSDVTDSI